MTRRDLLITVSLGGPTRWSWTCPDCATTVAVHTDSEERARRMIDRCASRCDCQDPPTVFSDAVPPGGFVCAVPVPGAPDGICGLPVESEPCTEHSPGGA